MRRQMLSCEVGTVECTSAKDGWRAATVVVMSDKLLSYLTIVKSRKHGKLKYGCERSQLSIDPATGARMRVRTRRRGTGAAARRILLLQPLGGERIRGRDARSEERRVGREG